MFDPAYSQLLDTNQELRSELQDEIFINKSNEKKVRSLVKELEQCYRTISLQDNTIIARPRLLLIEVSGQNFKFTSNFTNPS